MTFKAKNIFSIGKDAKTVKGEKFGYLTGILSDYEQDYNKHVSYNPYKYSYFYIKSQNDDSIFNADKVSFNNRLVTST